MRYFSKHFCLSLNPFESADSIKQDLNIVICCKDLQFALFDKKTMLKYQGTYWIVAEKNMTIEFCPWCGFKLRKLRRRKVSNK
jgi:hypothetical protein